MERSSPTYVITMAERVGLGRLFRSGLAVGDEIQGRLYGELQNSPRAALMGSLGSLIIVTSASIRAPSALFAAFIVLELVITAARLMEWRIRRSLLAAGGTIDVSWSAMLTATWCALQGAVAFVMLSGNDPVLHMLAAAAVMAMVGPVCARNYAAPRFATLLLILMDLPFVAGAILSDEPWLSVIVLLTPPFVLAARQIIDTFHETLSRSLIAEERNLKLALHDSLTGILNRQGMDERLGRISTKRHTMALVALDLDGFKGINDVYGHGVGDTVLIEVARRIAEIVGDDGIVARMGGDEFMVVVRHCGVAEVNRLGQRLVHSICDEDIVIARDLTVRVGASAGFACLPEDALTTRELRLHADRALYDAKDSGKCTCKRYRKPAQSIDEINDTLSHAYS